MMKIKVCTKSKMVANFISTALDSCSRFTKKYSCTQNCNKVRYYQSKLQTKTPNNHIGRVDSVRDPVYVLVTMKICSQSTRIEKDIIRLRHAINPSNFCIKSKLQAILFITDLVFALLCLFVPYTCVALDVYEALLPGYGGVQN